MQVLVVPFQQSFDDIGLTYGVTPEFQNEIKIGVIVEIEIRKKVSYAIITQIFDEPKYTQDDLKNIEKIVNHNIFFNKYTNKLLYYIAQYYFVSIHHVLQIMLPKNLREKIVKKKLKFESNKEYRYLTNNLPKLTIEQTKVYNTLIENTQKKSLLYGVTGSGKTQIYAHIIANNLKQNKQTLLLIPEIILSNQIFDKIKNIFGEDILSINSTVSEATKTKYWLDIYHNNAKIIIGTRSALFYPYDNLGSIIIDEEHDQSYISDSSPKYNAIDVAEYISNSIGCDLILGSGTPSINSMYKSVKGDLTLVQLLKKYQD